MGGDETSNEALICNIDFYFFQPDSLVSNVGGALSLYLGIAIIMAFELVELFWDILVALFSHCANSKPKKQF